jgi:hypothetical protein
VLRFVAGFGGGRKQLKEKKQGGKKSWRDVWIVR